MATSGTQSSLGFVAAITLPSGVFHPDSHHYQPRGEKPFGMGLDPRKLEGAPLFTKTCY